MKAVALLYLLPCIASAVGVPYATNRVDWYGYVGVNGGIPVRETIYTNFTSSATAANIQKAITDCPSNQVIYLAAGTYTINTTLDWARNNGVTLRGAGMDSTILQFTMGGGQGMTCDQYAFGAAQTISSGYTKDSTSVVLSASPGADIVVGNVVCISELDDTNFVKTSGSPGRNIQFNHVVTGVSGTTVTFTPPLPWTLASGLTPQMSPLGSGPGLTMSGVENLTITNTGQSSVVVEWWTTKYCWLKNVKIVGPVDSCVWLVDGFANEIRSCWFEGGANQSSNGDGYGTLMYGSTGSSAWNLIEDNISKNLFVHHWAKRASGNAYLFNFTTNFLGQGFAHQAGVLNAGHGQHPMMTLWEGNIAEQWQHDGYHGSASHQIVFRNWIHGLDASYSDNRKMIDCARGSYYYTIAGNVLGHNSWTNDTGFSYAMTGQPAYTEQSVIYRWGYPNVAGNGTDAGDVAVTWPLISNSAYPDTTSSNTAVLHGNYDTYTDLTDGAGTGIVWSSNSDHTLSNSLYYASSPSYWGNLTWPAFDPASPGSATVASIPAGYRFLYGTNPPASGGSLGNRSATVSGTFRAY